MGGSKIAASPGSRAKTIQRERNTPPIPKCPKQYQTLLGQHCAPGIVALAESQTGRSEERLGPYIRCHLSTVCQRLLQKRESFGAMATDDPEALQRRRQAQGHGRPCAFARPAQGRSEVVMLALQLLQPGDELRSLQGG